MHLNLFLRKIVHGLIFSSYENDRRCQEKKTLRNISARKSTIFDCKKKKARQLSNYLLIIFLSLQFYQQQQHWASRLAPLERTLFTTIKWHWLYCYYYGCVYDCCFLVVSIIIVFFFFPSLVFFVVVIVVLQHSPLKNYSTWSCWR